MFEGLGEAARNFERAIELAPMDPEIHVDSATLLQNLGRMDEAIRLEKTQARETW